MGSKKKKNPTAEMGIVFLGELVWGFLYRNVVVTAFMGSDYSSLIVKIYQLSKYDIKLVPNPIAQNACANMFRCFYI